jgi:hypothetical protein
MPEVEKIFGIPWIGIEKIAHTLSISTNGKACLEFSIRGTIILMATERLRFS